MQSIEAERRMSTIEKGYMYNTKVESQVNNSLVGFEKKIPSVLVQNPSTDKVDSGSQSQEKTKREAKTTDEGNEYG